MIISIVIRYRKVILVAAGLIFSFVVLVISILRTAVVKYSFTAINPTGSDKLTIAHSQRIGDIFIDYYPASPGPVLPDSFWWKFKVFRDKLWLLLMTDPESKARLNLLFADKRLLAAKILFEKGKYNLGYDTLTKAEKYLEKACMIEEEMRKDGRDTIDLAIILIKASLKHRQVIKQITLVAPGDAVAKIIQTENYPRGVYGRKIHILIDRGIIPPPDPFNGL